MYEILKEDEYTLVYKPSRKSNLVRSTIREAGGRDNEWCGLVSPPPTYDLRPSLGIIETGITALIYQNWSQNRLVYT